MTERISEMTIDHYRGQSDWYRTQTSGLGSLIVEMCVALQVEPYRMPELGEAIVAGMWTRSAILERIAQLREGGNPGD